MSISGKTLVFTGTLSLQRAEAKKMAEAAGAKVTTAVSGKTDILVAGDSAGSKIEEAKGKGVAVWTEDEFVAACKGGGKKSKANEAKAEPAAKKARTSSRKKKEEEEEDDDEEEEAPKPAPKKGRGKAKKAEEEEEEEEEAPKPAAKKGRGKAKKEEEEEEAPKPAPKKGRGKAKKEEEEEEEEEEEAPKPAPKKGRGKAKKAEEEEEAPKPAPKKGRGKAKKAEEEEEEEEEAPKAKEEKKAPQAAATQVAKGSGVYPVDSLVPGKASFKVYEDYACKLNQTNIGGNNNKYYIIQLLQGTDGNYAVWTRWGRVGEPGQHKLDRTGSNLDAAIKGFEKKFKEKTINHWTNRASFVKHNGKYQLVETEEGGDGEADDVPLGKLSKPQIEKGQAVLKNIETAIIQGKKSQLDELSSQFFSLIPTDFGRRRPEPIRTLDVLHAKEALLEFYLRMGFEDMKVDSGMTPISGVMDLPCPPTLKDAAHMICGPSDIDRCVTKGIELATKQVGKPKKTCSGELYASILLYTSNAIYAALNKALRDENRAAVKKYFNYLRLFLEAFDVLPQQACKLWRGIGVDLYDQYKVGSTITWWSVSSCTSDESVARGFAAGCGSNCTMITLQAKTACDISQITFYAHEKESLLAPGTQLKILDSKRVGKVTEILVEEVGRCLK